MELLHCRDCDAFFSRWKEEGMFEVTRVKRIINTLDGMIEIDEDSKIETASMDQKCPRSSKHSASSVEVSSEELEGLDVFSEDVPVAREPVDTREFSQGGRRQKGTGSPLHLKVAYCPPCRSLSNSWLEYTKNIILAYQVVDSSSGNRRIVDSDQFQDELYTENRCLRCKGLCLIYELDRDSFDRFIGILDRTKRNYLDLSEYSSIVRDHNLPAILVMLEETL